MAEINKDERQWKVQHVMSSNDCPELSIHAHIFKCDILDDQGQDDTVCTLETCPRRVQPKKHVNTLDNRCMGYGH